MDKDIRKYAERLLQKKLNEWGIKLQKEKGLTKAELHGLLSDIILGDQLNNEEES